MIGRIFRVLAVAAVLAALYVLFRPQADAVISAARDRWDILRKDTLVAQVPAGSVSPSTAMAAERKLARLGESSSRETLTGNELQSLLLYRYQQLLPEYVKSPHIALDQDHVAIHVRLPTRMLPATADLGRMLVLLPDTADVEIRGVVVPSSDGYIDFTVDALTAQRIPLPSRMVPPALKLFGRVDAPGLADDAIRLPLPDGMRTAYVRSDSLVVLAAGAR